MSTLSTGATTGLSGVGMLHAPGAPTLPPSPRVRGEPRRGDTLPDPLDVLAAAIQSAIDSLGNSRFLATA